MSKPENILILDPAQELKFKGPFAHPVTSHINLKNPSEKKVLFKIKTTAPKKYCVRPNSGAIDPGTSVEVAISLQPFVYDPNEKNKQKFMVQSLIAPDGDYNVEQLWKETSPDQLMDAKLRCTFELPDEMVKEDNISQLTSHLLKNESLMNEPNLAAGNVVTKSNDADFVRATAEVRDLREENSNMRQQILELKEQVVRLNSLVDTVKSLNTSYPNESSKSISNPYSPPQLGRDGMNMPLIYLIFGLVMVIFGVFLGKLAI